MFRKVLLCYDGTAEGRRALRQGADVVMCMKSEAYLLAISQNAVASSIPEGVSPMLAEQEDARAQSLLDEGVQWLRDRGVAAGGSLEFGRPVDCIPAIAEEVGADLIIVGHKQRGPLARWWSEGDEATLLERVSCSILVAMAPGDE
ncbi:MAG TPA: universal stress protein [Usitatibacter sp.]|jgi:nucleotide-binding universal stress UspA family protein|nr:universal stress protein [Usitatibacter sp.]